MNTRWLRWLILACGLSLNLSHILAIKMDQELSGMHNGFKTSAEVAMARCAPTRTHHQKNN